MNAALASAYVAKTGKTEEEILKMMDRETWINANQALEFGFVDAIAQDNAVMVNAAAGMRLTDEIRQQVMAEKHARDQAEEEKKQLLSDLDLYGI